MKKLLYSSLVLGLALCFSSALRAQNMYDALNFSTNEYFGPARSMALGNAVTAIGGDLGTIGINPAGSAVASYSQLTFTPGLNISIVNSSFDNGQGNNVPSGNVRDKGFVIPNFGASIVFDTGNRKGLRSFVFAVTSNQTSQYSFYSEAYGSNNQTAKSGEMAAAAYGFAESALGNYNSFDSSNIPWDVLTAYQAGQFGSFGYDGEYAGVGEYIAADGLHYVPGRLTQASLRTKSGSKNDLVFNFGANISDRLYLGFNLGVPSGTYTYEEYFNEAAEDPANFPIIFLDGNNEVETNYRGSSNTYMYTADIDGIYAKFGAILRPVAGLRLGAAFQAPARYTISERWQYAATSTFGDSRFNGNMTSPQGNYSYQLRTPYILDLGVAYTVGSVGFVSVDYELMDYSVMRFTDLHAPDMVTDAFYDINQANRNFAGVSNSLRLGVEFKLLPSLSLRAGYSTTSCPERYWTNDRGQTVDADSYLANFDDYQSGLLRLVKSRYYDEPTRSFSFGAGYSSSDSFFIDLAFKKTTYSDSSFRPYYDYINYDEAGNQVNQSSPLITTNRSLINIVCTLGWRF